VLKAHFIETEKWWQDWTSKIRYRARLTTGAHR
jgi:hypothetical protein